MAQVEVIDLMNASEVMHLDVDQLIVDRTLNTRAFQSADKYTDPEFKELMASIQAHGVLQPVLFSVESDDQPHLRMGDRRLEAVKRLREANPSDDRFKTIPAIAITSSDAQRILKASYDENARRKSNSAMDDAFAIKLYEDSGMKGGAIAKAMGKSQGWVSQRRVLINLAPELQAKVHKGELDSLVAYELAKKPVETQVAAAKEVEREQKQSHAVKADTAATTGDKKGKTKKGKAKAKKGRPKGKLGRANIKNIKGAKTTKKGKLKIAKSANVAVVAGTYGDAYIYFGSLAKSGATASIKTLGRIIVSVMDGKLKGRKANAAIAKLLK